MKKEERLNALEVALTNETREREFYLKSAERCRNKLGKSMFKQIADDELEHYDRLKEIQARWKKEQKWPESLPVKVKGTAVKDILKDFLLKAEASAPGNDDDLKAVRTALEFEAKGEKFYAQLRDASDGPEGEGLLRDPLENGAAALPLAQRHGRLLRGPRRLVQEAGTPRG